MEASIERVDLVSLPTEMLYQILQHLAPRDLCHVALCNKSMREAANCNTLWRPLCQAEGWEHFGTAINLAESSAFVPVDKHGDCDVNFTFDTITCSTYWPGLVGTCTWKQVYMKAYHIGNNWRTNRYHSVSFAFGAPGCPGLYRPSWNSPSHLQIYNLYGEGHYLAAGVSNSTVMVWDMYSGKLQHTIHVDICDKRQCLKIKNGTIAIGCRDGMIRTYSTQTGQQLQVMSCHRLSVSKLFIDDDTIVSVARPGLTGDDSYDTFEDSDIRIWCSLNGSLRFRFRREKDSSKDIMLQDVDYMNKTVAAVYVDRTIQLWNAQSGVCMHVIRPSLRMDEVIQPLTYCHLCNETLIVGDMGNIVEMYDVKSGGCCKTFNIPEGCGEDADDEITLSCEFTGGFLVVESDCGNIRICSLEGKYIGETKTAEDTPIMHPSCLHSNKLIASDKLTGASSLWMIHKDSGVHAVNNLREIMFQSDVESEFFEFWMSDTKLAFVHYFNANLTETLVQVPYIAVRHYW